MPRTADVGRRTSDVGPRASTSDVGPRTSQSPTRRAGAIYSVDPTLRREFQALPLRAVTARPTTVTWLVDGTPIGTRLVRDAALAWPLAVGTHEIEARDPQGRRARTSVVVK